MVGNDQGLFSQIFLCWCCASLCLYYLVGSCYVLLLFFAFCVTHLVVPQKGEKKKKKKKMSNTDTLQEQRKNKKEMEFELKLAREKEEMQEREKQLKINRLVQEVRKDVVSAQRNTFNQTFSFFNSLCFQAVGPVIL